VSEPRHGLVAGRFEPPHAGHHLLIRTAARVCARVTVRVLGSAADRIPVERRLAWLREIHAPERNVAVQSAAEPEPRDVDAVFGPRHLAVDPRRELVPVSSRALRADPIAHWEQLAPPVRAYLARRLVIGGAESTGKTTFARDLRDALAARGGAFAETRWVPELGRDYTIDLLALERARAALRGEPEPGMEALVWRTPDFVAIARGQNALEDAEARCGGPVLVCDTDAFATAIWHERYLGRRAPEVEVLADPRPSLYLLTHPHDVRFEADAVRDGETLRGWMTDAFVERLRASPHRFELVRGSRETRVARACALLDAWLAEGFGLADPAARE
jgi:HTH-type transcriptional regulator, transcriptional repressor of NAD biosynthesis genes